MPVAYAPPEGMPVAYAPPEEKPVAYAPLEENPVVEGNEPPDGLRALKGLAPRILSKLLIPFVESRILVLD